MGCLERKFFRDMNWKTSAIVNTVAMCVLSLLMTCVLVASLAKTGGLNRSWMFYDGDCATKTPRLTTGLGLLINAISTTILASSNFFQQLLSAPSRREAVIAHAKGSSLDIGIRSWRNFFYISRWKTLLWFTFLLPSIPIHLFLNSTIFQIDKRETYFQITVSVESFLFGSPWYAPGASLQAGAHWDLSPNHTLSKSDYISAGSDAITNITETVASANTWERLSPEECAGIDELHTCSGVYAHSHVLVIVASTPAGWTRQQFDAVNESQVNEWADLNPFDRNNSLWYSSGCQITPLDRSGKNCTNTCNAVIPTKLQPINGRREDPKYGVKTDLAGELNVTYCLAKRIEDQCRIGLSNSALLAATLCTVFMFICCAVATFSNLNLEDSLVTIGDAISAFMDNPDPTLSTKSLFPRKAPKRRTLHDFRTSAMVAQPSIIAPGPRRWNHGPKMRGAAITTWDYFYIWVFVAFGIGFLVYLLVASSSPGVNVWNFSLDQPSWSQGIYSGSFMSVILLVNSPQLYLALGYAAYNTVFTRFETAREWALLSTDYRPLRVTRPKGDQVSSYFLQLRYRYSVPLLVMSTILHWLLSESFYLSVIEGDYFRHIGLLSTQEQDPNIPPNTAILFGYSMLPIMLTMSTISVLIIALEIFSRMSLPGTIPITRSQSMAIAAVCQRPRVLGLTSPTTQADNTTAQVRIENVEEHGIVSHYHILGSTRSSGETKTSLNGARGNNRQPTECKIKWGRVDMPREWHDKYTDFGQPVNHLSFGTNRDNVLPPIEGHWYA